MKNITVENMESLFKEDLLKIQEMMETPEKGAFVYYLHDQEIISEEASQQKLTYLLWVYHQRLNHCQNMTRDLILNEDGTYTNHNGDKIRIAYSEYDIIRVSAESFYFSFDKDIFNYINIARLKSSKIRITKL
jgi:hypothetical protein